MYELQIHQCMNVRSVYCGSSCLQGRPRPRILCTGLGVVSAAGVGVDAFWKNVVNGVNNCDTVKTFDTTDMACKGELFLALLLREAFAVFAGTPHKDHPENS